MRNEESIRSRVKHVKQEKGAERKNSVKSTTCSCYPLMITEALKKTKLTPIISILSV